MQDGVRLEDIGYILFGLGVVALCAVLIGTAATFGPHVLGFLRAVAHRYFNVDAWQAWLDRLVDLGGRSVNDNATPAAITSSAPSGTPPPVPVRGDTVAPDTYQSVPSVPAPRNDAPSAATAHNLSALDDDELFTQIVLLKRNGDWLLSANALAQSFGGERATRLKQIAKLRNEATPDNDASKPPTARAPISGREIPHGTVFQDDLIKANT